MNLNVKEKKEEKVSDTRPNTEPLTLFTPKTPPQMSKVNRKHQERKTEWYQDKQNPPDGIRSCFRVTVHTRTDTNSHKAIPFVSQAMRSPHSRWKSRYEPTLFALRGAPPLLLPRTCHPLGISWKGRTFLSLFPFSFYFPPCFVGGSTDSRLVSDWGHIQTLHKIRRERGRPFCFVFVFLSLRVCVLGCTWKQTGYSLGVPGE